MRLLRGLIPDLLGGTSAKKIWYGTWAVSLVAALAIFLPSFLIFYPGLTFHYLVGGSVAILFLGPSIVGHFQEVKKKRIDNALPLLLNDIGEGQETGMTLLESLKEVSNRDYGPISNEIKRLVSQLSWGVDFGTAFQAFTSRIGTTMTLKVSVLIVEAVNFGGVLKTAFRSTAEFLRNILELRQERESQLRPFFMVIYVSSFIFDLIVIILYQSFILPLAPVPVADGGVSFLRMPLTLGEFRSILFDMAVIEAFFGGLAAGKFGTGKAISGLKHSVVLMGVAIVVFWAFF